MKRNLLKTLGLSAMLLLTSCGSTPVDGTLYIGDGFTKKNAIIFKYNFNSILEEGSKISGSISAQENAVLKNEYIFSYTSTNPRNTTNFAENVLVGFTKENLSDGKEAKYDLALNLKKVFPGTEEINTVYFIIHSDDWKTSDDSTYTSTSFKYSWDGERVKINLDYGA